jgi:hypothetical protein
MRVLWGVAAAAGAFGAGLWLSKTELQVRGIYRIGKAIGRREGAKEEAAWRGVGVPADSRRPVGSKS